MLEGHKTGSCEDPSSVEREQINHFSDGGQPLYQMLIYGNARVHFCVSLLRISVVTKLSFVSALNSRKHVKLNNKKIKSVTYTESLVYISLCEFYILLRILV